jgi:transposase-like protein
MTTSLRAAVAKAVQLFSPSLEDLAGELGVSTSALRRWRDGSRQVPSELSSALAATLRSHAWKLEQQAQVLDKLTGGNHGEE